MEAIRIIVNGAKGRMGREATAAIEKDPELTLVGQTDIDDDLSGAVSRSSVHVVVDFTTASAAFENTRIILETGVRPVIGTSGLLPEQVETLQAIAAQKGLGGVIAPNFAIGAVLMMKFAGEAAKYMPHAEIIELHHDRKADAPSGTAIKTASLVAGARTEIFAARDEKEILPGARGASAEGIPVHSIRLPGLVAHQEVIFGGPSQTLTIRHDSIHRESFMPGVCLACKKVMGLRELVYGLEHIL